MQFCRKTHCWISKTTVCVLRLHRRLRRSGTSHRPHRAYSAPTDSTAKCCLGHLSFVSVMQVSKSSYSRALIWQCFLSSQQLIIAVGLWQEFSHQSVGWQSVRWKTTTWDPAVRSRTLAIHHHHHHHPLWLDGWIFSLGTATTSKNTSNIHHRADVLRDWVNL